MADRSPDLSANAIATLVREIGELRRTAEGTLIDQAKLKSRYDDATAGLLTNDRFDPEAWKALPELQQTATAAKLSSLKNDLLGPWPGTEDGPADPHNLMHRQYASNRMIYALTAFALLGLLFDLFLIIHEWDTATGGNKTILDFCFLKPLFSCVEAKATPTPLPAARDSSTGTSNQTPSAASSATSATPSPSPEGADSVMSSPSVTSPAKSPVASPKPSPPPAATPPPSGDENKDNKAPSILTKSKVTEQAVLWMVVLLGALGGFLHLASSMANFVGNRQLLRSWVVYYILIPFQGAALAPVVYLLLRVGVLNPANSSGGHPTDALNLIGIYAFAAMTGLFSKKAIEMLATVFETVFRKSDTSDSLEKKGNPKKPGG